MRAARWSRNRRNAAASSSSVVWSSIDLMNLSGFCRNCLSRWYQEAAAERGIEMSKDDAREIVYGMPYDAWRATYQTEASAEQKAAFDSKKPDH
ncbi:MAG: DUF1244 domain-containing protein [Pseudomonadota bacterium]